MMLMNPHEFRERAGALAIKLIDALTKDGRLPSYTIDGFHLLAQDLHYAELLVQATDFAADLKLVLPAQQLDEMLVLAEGSGDIDLLQNQKDLRAAADAWA